jgi:hypothetical protein
VQVPVRCRRQRAIITLLRSSAWLVQFRRNGTHVAETYLRKTEAQDRGIEKPTLVRVAIAPHYFQITGLADPGGRAGGLAEGLRT